jgi:hypothetical protein
MALIKHHYPIPLANKLKALLSFQLTKEALPPTPIVYVDKHVCKLSNNSMKARNMGLIPLLLMVLFTVYLNIDDFCIGWEKKEKSTQHKIRFYKREYGENYFLSPQVHPIDKRNYEMLDENGDLSLSNYMQYRYYTTAKVGGTYRLKKDISLLVFYAVTIPLLLFFIIRFKRQAPMVFDRDKQIVYLWYKGKVRAQHFKDLRIYEDFQMMRIQTRGFDKHNNMQWANFMVQPRHNPYYNGKDAYEPVLAFICQFMEYGREHVMPQCKQWQTDDKPFAFFDDEKPKDFAQQLNAVLTHLSENDTDIPLDKDNLPIPPV